MPNVRPYLTNPDPDQPDLALLASMRIRYQPIVHLAGTRPDYAEVLARAAGENGQMHGAESFVNAMSLSSEVALSLTAAIMRRSLAEYRAYGFAKVGLVLAFNLPLDAMLHPELIAEIEALREAAGLATENICFELTETSPVEDLSAAAASIKALHAAGHGIALDDITPEMPYLEELMALPIRAIKFSHELVIDQRSAPFIRAMSAQASARGQDSIAEGIETKAQLRAMREAGVTHGQGYLFARPVPASELATTLSPCGNGLLSNL